MTKSAIDLISGVPWAITDDALQTIISVAERSSSEFENHPNRIDVLEAKIGEKLRGADGVTVRGETAVIPVVGPIFRYANLFTRISGATSLEMLSLDFAKALEDETVKNIVLVLDSPGGQATGISEFAQMVKAADKPVVAYVDGMAASAAYWIASAADKVAISKTAELGSIGAVLGVNTRQPDGVVKIISSQSPLKQAGPLTPEGKQELQTRIDSLAQIFVEDVAAYRGVESKTVLENFGRGGIKIGAEAVSLGMADEVTTFEAIIASLNINHFDEGDFSMSSETKKGGESVTLTADQVKADYPEIASALIDEGRAAGKVEGASAELERIKSVHAQSLSGHEDYILGCMFDGKTTGPEAAVGIVQRENQKKENTLSNLKSGAEEPFETPPTGDDLKTKTGEEPGEGATAEERARHKWDNDPKVRAEFDGDFEGFFAFEKANDSGLVKIKS